MACTCGRERIRAFTKRCFADIPEVPSRDPSASPTVGFAVIEFEDDMGFDACESVKPRLDSELAERLLGNFGRGGIERPRRVATRLKCHR